MLLRPPCRWPVRACPLEDSLRRTRISLVATLAVATSAVLVGVPAAADAAPTPKPSVPVQLIAMNDFHGRITNTTGADSQLLTSPGPDGVYGDPNPKDTIPADDTFIEVGGSANVASTVERLQSEFRRQSGPSAASY